MNHILFCPRLHILMVGKGARIWGQKFKSSRQAKIESSPKHSSYPLYVGHNPCEVGREYHYRVMNLSSNVQGWGPVCFGDMDCYKSHARTNSSQLRVVTFYLTHPDSIRQQSSHEYHYMACSLVFPLRPTNAEICHDCWPRQSRANVTVKFLFQ